MKCGMHKPLHEGPCATDTGLRHAPVTQAYGHSHNSQYTVLPCCTAAQTSAECCLEVAAQNGCRMFHGKLSPCHGCRLALYEGRGGFTGGASTMYIEACAAGWCVVGQPVPQKEVGTAGWTEKTVCSGILVGHHMVTPKGQNPDQNIPIWSCL